MNPPFVSILTPVYNTEKYLPECIESVMSQTYTNWEYIIVNNKSTDRSLEIMNSYAEKDNRIMVHNNTEFLGMLQNWNHALQFISPESKYCKIVHADDWIFPECIERMVERAEANPSVGIVGAYSLQENDVKLTGLSHVETVISGIEICRRRLLGMPYIFGSPTSILIRSDLIRKRDKFYNESNFHADLEACFDLLKDSDFGFVHQILTFTRRHNEANTAFSRRMNSYYLGDLQTFLKYGHVFLNDKEFQEVETRKLNLYYQYLGHMVVKRKGKDFWDYHKKGLKEAGYPLSLIRLTKASLIHVYNRALQAFKID